MKNGPGIQQLPGKFALRRRALHRRKQGSQRRPVFRAGILLQGSTQRQMLHVALLGNPMRIGGQKRERMSRIAFVFRKMKCDPPHGVPQWITAFEIRDRSAGSTGNSRVDVSIQFLPQPGQDGAIQVLQSLHRRRGLYQSDPIVLGRFRDPQLSGGVQVRGMTEGREVMPGQTTPKDKCRRQRLM